MEDGRMTHIATPVRTDETMSWRSFTVRLIEALRWPFAFVVIFYLLRLPISELIASTAQALAR